LFCRLASITRKHGTKRVKWPLFRPRTQYGERREVVSKLASEHVEGSKMEEQKGRA
jgi:hypothetical protein